MFCLVFLLFLLPNLWFTLFLQVLGAAWYLLSIDRYTSCWKSFCKKELSPKCDLHFLDCDSMNRDDWKRWANTTKVFKNCDASQELKFKFGIFQNAVTKNVVSSNFIEKYFYCLWWGLQNLRFGSFHWSNSYLIFWIYIMYFCSALKSLMNSYLLSNCLKEMWYILISNKCMGNAQIWQCLEK